MTGRLQRQLRTSTVAADVGRLAELASRTFRAGDVDDLGRTIQAELADVSVPGVPLTEDDQAVDAHLCAHGDRHD